MKHTLELVIDLPRERVIELFDNPDNMKEWQEGFLSFEHLSGEPGCVGATSKLRYKMGKRDVELIETITVHNLPDEFSGTYETKGVWNKIENRFIPISGNKTKWLLESEFRCTGFLRLIGFFAPGMFKKQSIELMKRFKAFAERAN